LRRVLEGWKVRFMEASSIGAPLGGEKRAIIAD
jgi:hypothetical protein